MKISEACLYKTAKLLTSILPLQKWRIKGRKELDIFLNKLFKTEKAYYLKVCGRQIVKNLALSKDKYKICSLGRNCYPRMFSTFWGFKLRRNQGELSMPFDLSVHPVVSMNKILKNDFSDYFENIFYNGFHWINDQYNIKFIHDKMPEKDEFVKRYQKRINHFRNLLNTDIPVFFILHIEQEDSVEEVNCLFSFIKENRKDKKFKLLVTGYDVEKTGLDPQILTYFKPLPYQNYTFMEDRMKLNREGFRFELPLMLLLRKTIKKLIEK